MEKEKIVREVIAKMDDISEFLGEDSYSRIKMHFLSDNVMSEVDSTAYIVWDLETSGFVAPESKILEIGCFEVMKSGEIKQHHWIINNRCEISEKITSINGFTKEICEEQGREPVECMTEFLKIITNAPLNVTHNGIRFDIPFLVAYAKDVLGHSDEYSAELMKTLKERARDTAVHYKAKKAGMDMYLTDTYLSFAERVMDARLYGVKYSLGLCCEEEKIDMSGITLHRALGDVAMTHELYKLIKNK